MDRWFNYVQGNWHICINAVSRQDATAHAKVIAPQAKFVGEGCDLAPKTATGAVTEKRQAEIRSYNQREEERWAIYLQEESEGE